MTSLEALSREQLDAMREWAGRSLGTGRWYGTDEGAVEYVERWYTDKPSGGVSAFLADHEEKG